MDRGGGRRQVVPQRLGLTSGAFFIDPDAIYQSKVGEQVLDQFKWDPPTDVPGIPKHALQVDPPPGYQLVRPDGGLWVIPRWNDFVLANVLKENGWKLPTNWRIAVDRWDVQHGDEQIF